MSKKKKKNNNNIEEMIEYNEEIEDMEEIIENIGDKEMEEKETKELEKNTKNKEVEKEIKKKGLIDFNQAYRMWKKNNPKADFYDRESVKVFCKKRLPELKADKDAFLKLLNKY